MSQLKCPLCGKSTKFGNVTEGERLVCRHCQSSFAAPAPPPKMERVKKSSKAEKTKHAEEAKTRIKKQESLVFYGKFIGFGFLGLIVAGIVFQIVASAGASFIRSSQTSALEIDLKWQYAAAWLQNKEEFRAAGMLERSVQIRQLVLDWGEAESNNGEVPFTAQLVGNTNNIRTEVRGVLKPSSGIWLATYGGRIALNGQISTWKSLPVVIAFILAGVALVGVGQIWRKSA